MKGLKLVVIGAGSSYTPELMEGIIKRQNEFPIRELWLVDIEDGREKNGDHCGPHPTDAGKKWAGYTGL